MTVHLKPDGKHPLPCVLCREPTYRQDMVCKRCTPPEKPKPEVCREFAARLDGATLEACVTEYLKRHQERVATVARIMERAA